MQITMHTYDSSADFRAELDDLMLEAFGFTFAAWQQTGAWNADYSAYGILENGRILANACVYRMDLLVRGHKQEAFQIGAVATRKERRGEGLSRRILQCILDRHPDGAFFLFANPGVLHFYPRFGFRPVQQRQACLRLRRPLAKLAPGAMRRLSPGEFLSTTRDSFQQRACFSRVLDCTNAAPINLFNLLYEYSEIAYEIADLQALLVAEQHGSELTIIDVCATRPLTFNDLLPYLDFPGADTLRFGFNPDWLAVDCQWQNYEEEGAFFVRGPLDLDEDCLVPWMIKT